jgi:hypothetical protein
VAVGFNIPNVAECHIEVMPTQESGLTAEGCVSHSNQNKVIHLKRFKYMDSIASLVIIGLIFLIVLYFSIIILCCICNWKIYEKAGYKGWNALIPIWNTVILCKIAGVSIWWGALSILLGVVISVYPYNSAPLWFLVFLQLFISIFISTNLALRFGKKPSFGLGLIFLPFVYFPILAFGKAQYDSDENNDNDKLSKPAHPKRQWRSMTDKPQPRPAETTMVTIQIPTKTDFPTEPTMTENPMTTQGKGWTESQVQPSRPPYGIVIGLLVAIIVLIIALLIVLLF